MEKPNHLRSKSYFIVGNREVPIGFQAHNEETAKTFSQLGIEETTQKFINIKKIAKEINEKDFHGYSSVMFFIDIDILDYNRQYKDPMEGIYCGLRKNASLRHATKFLMFYSSEPNYLSDSSRMVDKNLQFESPIQRNLSQRELLEKWTENTALESEYTDRFQEFLLMNIPNIDNLTIIRVCTKSMYMSTILFYFFRFENADLNYFLYRNLEKHKFGNKMPLIFMFPSVYSAVQEMADEFRESSRYFLLSFASTCAGGCFIFNINPALVLVINHITSPDEEILDSREESLYDLIALQRTFVGKRMPTYMITDGSLEDIQRLKLKLRLYNFSGIKDIYIIINAHGFDEDIIVTKTGSYNVRDDIWLPMLENESLRDAQKFVIVNACRHELDSELMKLLEKLQHKFNENIRPSADEQVDKAMFIYSTQKGCDSYRIENLGCIFLQEWSTVFAMDFDEKLMETICEDTKQILERDCDQVPDFTSEEGQVHKIKMQPENFANFKPLLESLLDGNLRRNGENDIVFMDALVTHNSENELVLVDFK